MRRVGSRLLTTALLVMQLVAGSVNGGSDNDGGTWLGTITNEGHQVSIDATKTVTTPSESSERPWDYESALPPVWNPDPIAPSIRTEDGRTQQVCDNGNSRCLSDELTPEAEAEPEEGVEIPEFTLEDVAVFAPEPPALDSEPAGVGIVGMPVNFIVPATTHTVAGELFDIPLQVRFSPVSYDFTYGDGDTRHTTTGGSTWPSLDQPQLTATPTSHAYGERGMYTVSVDVNYAASIDLGSGWFDVPGTLTLTTPASTVEVLELHTALVEHTCVEDPTGPGC